MRNNKEYRDACERVARSGYEFIKKKINKEIRNSGNENKQVNINIITGLIIQSIAMIDANALRTVKAMYQKYDPKGDSHIGLMTLYFAQLLDEIRDDASIIVQNLADEFACKKKSKVN